MRQLFHISLHAQIGTRNAKLRFLFGVTWSRYVWPAALERCRPMITVLQDVRIRFIMDGMREVRGLPCRSDNILH